MVSTSIVMYKVPATQGKGISGIVESEVEMKQGDTMFDSRGAVHWFYNPFDEPVEMIFIYTKPSLKSAGYQIVE